MHPRAAAPQTPPGSDNVPEKGLFEVADVKSEDWRPVAVVWLAWTLLAVFMMFNHEPWRDEIHAWSLASGVRWPWDLFGYIQGEGHPPGWYLLLWPISRISPWWGTVQVVAVALGSAAAWLVLRHFPVSLGVRALVVFSYFPLYELSVVARNYVLAYLFVIVALWLAHRPGTHPALVAFALLGSVGASLTTLPLVVAMALGFWGGRWWASPTRQPARWGWIAAVVGPLVVAALVLRPSRGGSSAVDLDRVNAGNLWDVTAAPLLASIPISPLQLEFWGTLTAARWGTWGSLLGLAVIVAVAVAVRHSLSALTIWLVSSAGFVFLVAFAGQGLPPRNVAAVWTAGVAAVWVAAADRAAKPPARRRRVPVAVAAGASLVLAAGLWANLWAAWSDGTTPFTAADGAAQWIADNATGDVVILCAIIRPHCSAVAARLGAPAYSNGAGEPFEFVEWTPGWQTVLVPSTVEANARVLAERTGKEVFVVAPMADFPAGCSLGWVPGRTIIERLMVCRADQLIDPFE